MPPKPRTFLDPVVPYTDKKMWELTEQEFYEAINCTTQWHKAFPTYNERQSEQGQINKKKFEREFFQKWEQYFMDIGWQEGINYCLYSVNGPKIHFPSLQKDSLERSGPGAQSVYFKVLACAIFDITLNQLCDQTEYVARNTPWINHAVEMCLSKDEVKILSNVTQTIETSMFHGEMTHVCDFEKHFNISFMDINYDKTLDENVKGYLRMYPLTNVEKKPS